MVNIDSECRPTKGQCGLLQDARRCLLRHSLAAGVHLADLGLTGEDTPTRE